MVDIYQASERRGKYLMLVTDTEGDSCFSICPVSVNRSVDNLSFKCSKIVKNALYLKKACIPSCMNAKK